MTYAETINYLYNATPVFEHIGAGAYKEGLSNTIALDRHFGHPHRHFKSIHVAGTNGKGSCSHTLAAILQAEGYKVGLYTSPHIVDFRERIRVDGECISEDYVVKFVESERAFFEPLHPSFFELTTALAFKYFAEQKVDIAVIEVGLGGRLDCTNIIAPLLSVITNISLDHTQFLGDTRAKIAAEKAGIIKHLTPVVIGEADDETRPVFAAKAAAEEAPITFAEDAEAREVTASSACPSGGIDFTTRSFGTLHYELSGEYQVKNMNTILCAVRELQRQGIVNDARAVSEGVQHVCDTTGLVGRWQRINDAPLAVCDTGHNVGGWQYLAHQIGQQQCRTRRIVFGMVDDKDIDTVLGLLPRDAVFYFTQASCKRAIPVATVVEKARSHGLDGRAFATVKEAYAQALAEADAADFIFVGGSSYVVSDLLSR